MSNFEVKLIRHATGTHMNDADLVTGRAVDAQLTDAGYQEAEAAGARLAEREIIPDVVFASPAHRAHETARVVLNSMGVRMPIHTNPLLHEMDMGELVGKPRSEVYTDTIQAEIKRLGSGFRLPGGESVNDVGFRGFLYLDQHRHASVNIHSSWGFAHAGLIACTVGAIEGWDYDKIVAMRKTIVPVSETTLVLDKGEWHLDTFAKPLAD